MSDADDTMTFGRQWREMKNFVFQYTKEEQLVREATCSDPPLSPPESLMREIARATFSVESDKILNIIWKRMGSAEEYQVLHPLKSMILLEFLITDGNSERVLKQVNTHERLELIRSLCNYPPPSEYGGLGLRVREQAHRLLRVVRGETVAPRVPDGSAEGAAAAAPAPGAGEDDGAADMAVEDEAEVAPSPAVTDGPALADAPKPVEVMASPRLIDMDSPRATAAPLAGGGFADDFTPTAGFTDNFAPLSAATPTSSLPAGFTDNFAPLSAATPTSSLPAGFADNFAPLPNGFTDHFGR